MQLSPHCYALTGFAYTPPWSVNAGIIVGTEQTLIVDSGPTALAAGTILGYAQAVRPLNRLLVINTEQHLDHIGGNCRFVDAGIDVYGHAEIRRRDVDLADDIEEFINSTPNAVRRERREGEILFANTHIVNPTKTISSDTSFDLGDVAVEIILTPGHTPTNLCVYVPAERVLFCGDTIVSGYLPNLECGTAENWRTWLSSLDRLAELDVDRLVCGHGPVVSGRSVGREMERVRSVIEQAIRSGRPPTA